MFSTIVFLHIAKAWIIGSLPNKSDTGFKIIIISSVN